MNMNKKIVGIVVSATAAVALSACGGTDTNRADITPEALQALEQALKPSWTPLTATGVHVDHSTGTVQDTEARVTMLESDGSAGFYVTYMVVNGVVQRVHMTRGDYDHGFSEYRQGRGQFPVWALEFSANSFTFVPDFSYFDVGGWRAEEFEIAPDGTRSTTNTWRGHIVYGTPTEVMPVAGTATYDGQNVCRRLGQNG